MTKTVLTLITLLVLCTAVITLAGTVEPPEECVSCGMNRTTFAQSRMVVTFGDNSSAATCSVNCAVQVMGEKRGKMLKSAQVADYDSRKLIDARTASWVIGGDRRGVMSPVAKWAFADRKGAEAFIRKHGGVLTSFDDVLKETEKELEGAGQPASHGHGQSGHGGHGM